MIVETRSISVTTQGNCDIIDLTNKIEHELLSSKANNGTVTVFVSGSTAGITTVEYESGLINDLKHMFERIIPQNLEYQHNLKWGDGNGHAHVRASLLGASLSIPFSQKRMKLGTWQQVVLIDFDNRPRRRDIVVQIMGE